MIIPREPRKRDAKLKRILEQCIGSQGDRQSLYERRRRYFLFGTHDVEGNSGNGSKFNRLQAHADLVASFLYSADHARYAISASRNAPKQTIKKVLAVEEHWNDIFVQCGLANLLSDAVLWATVYDTMIPKLGWNEARSELVCTLVEPHSFGVYNEREPDIDSQEAFVHTYALDLDNAILRLQRAGKLDQIKRLGTISGPRVAQYPPVLSNLIISSTGGRDVTGPIIGQASPDYNIRANYEAAGDQPMIKFHEIWAWDDASDDYATFHMADPDIVLSDSRETIATMARYTGKQFSKQWASDTNIFIKGEHPFAPITPYPIYNYFWGESFAERLIPLQDWSNERLGQIAEILEKQVDPAKVFSGFMGLQDEKAGALGGPGSWVVDQMPGAKVEELKPDMPEDLFREFKEIGEIFLEASGLTQTVTGKGEQGVRGGGHAGQLARTGSSRIRKTAVGLEGALAKAGDIGLKLVQRNDDTHLIDDLGEEVLAAQIGSDWKMRIAGHSHSPLFQDELRADAEIMLKAGAIEKEDFIRMLNPPNADNLVHGLREREKKREQLIAEHPELLTQHAGGKKHAA